MGMRRAFVRCFPLAGCMVLAACVEAGNNRETELGLFEAQALEGVSRIQQALADPQLRFEWVGEGERQVDAAARSLLDLAQDPETADPQRLRAALAQARAYDDLVRALTSPRAASQLAPEPRAVLSKALDDRALPARAAAQAGFGRALSILCAAGLDDHPALLEILDGLSRYEAPAPPPGHPCD